MGLSRELTTNARKTERPFKNPLTCEHIFRYDFKSEFRGHLVSWFWPGCKFNQKRRVDDSM